MKHDPKRAQWIIDKTFWISARLFSILTGPGMDYYTPLEHRKQSYKEFMEEWIITEFLRLIEDYGLKKPWYWQEFIDGLDTWHHSLHLGVWFWRPTVWWKPQAGVSKAERAWLRPCPGSVTCAISPSALRLPRIIRITRCAAIL
jgi:toluene monooxygenase system protein A